MGNQLGKELVEPHRVTRLVRLPEVQNRVGMSRSTIYRWMAEGRFPKPVPLGSHSVAWNEKDIDAWVQERLL